MERILSSKKVYCPKCGGNAKKQTIQTLKRPSGDWNNINDVSTCTITHCSACSYIDRLKH